MSNASPAKEPSMEEILASIRRIIESGDERPVLGGLGTKGRDRTTTSIPSPGAQANDRVASVRRENVAAALQVTDPGVLDIGPDTPSTDEHAPAGLVDSPAAWETASRETASRADGGRELSIGNTDAASSLESAVGSTIAGRDVSASSRSTLADPDAAEPSAVAVFAWPQAERASDAGRPAALDAEGAESDRAPVAMPSVAFLSDAYRPDMSANDTVSARPPAPSTQAIASEAPKVQSGASLAGGSSTAAETHDFSLEFDEESFSAELSGEFGADAPAIDAGRPKGTDAPEAKDEGEEVASAASVMAEASSLMSQEAGAQVAAAFDDLARAIRDGQMKSMEDMAREMLRPMLQDWLDDNLPRLVEKLVREEIERVARGPRR